MTHYSTSPKDKTLSRLVQSIWCYQSEPTHEFERVLPGINPQLLINFHENELRHWADARHKLRTTGPVAIQGILTQPVIIDTKQKCNVCGVEFTRIGLSSFCNVAMTGFTDTLVDANDIWGNEARYLYEDLNQNTKPSARCLIIEKFLLRQLHDKKENDLDLLEDIVFELECGHSLSSICRHFNLSQRALHGLFERITGVRPKTFARVGRFSSTLKPIASQQPLINIAMDYGFSDQAHLSREFRAFSGSTPKNHHPLANEHRHVKIEADKIFKI